jgi:Tol biopolymer transport system component
MHRRSAVRLAGLVALLAALAAAGVVAAPGAASGNRPGPRPGNELIVFQRSAVTPGAPSKVWVMDGDGHGQMEISHTPVGASDTAPSMSLSQGLVVWQRTRLGVPEIVGGDVFGDPTTNLTSFAGGASDPSLSCRLQVAFSVGSGADCNVWVMDAFGAHKRRLTDHGQQPGCDAMPVWSPDGRRVDFRRTVTDATGRALSSAEYVVPATGGTPSRLPLAATLVSSFGWAPGRQFLELTRGPHPVLQAVDANGNGVRALARADALVGTPTWAPMSARAAFVQTQADGSTDILTVSGSGGSTVNLTRSPGVSEGHPSWGYPSNQGSEPCPGVHARSLPARRRRRR